MYGSHSIDQCRIFAQVAPITILQSNPVASAKDGHWFGFILFQSTIFTEIMCPASAGLWGYKDEGGMAPDLFDLTDGWESQLRRDVMIE